MAFGDAWVAGYRCGGCRTFAALWADGIQRQTGSAVVFTDLTAAAESAGGDWGSTASLKANLRAYRVARRETAAADVVLIATGSNETPMATDLLEAGICAGADGRKCLRELGLYWRSNFDAILVTIAELRGGRPTVIRLVNAPNRYLGDATLAARLGPDFATTTGSEIMGLLRDAACASAAEYDAVCVDVLPIVNGPSGERPGDDQSSQTMEAVADALLATGLPELAP